MKLVALGVLANTSGKTKACVSPSQELVQLIPFPQI